MRFVALSRQTLGLLHLNSPRVYLATNLFANTMPPKRKAAAKGPPKGEQATSSNKRRKNSPVPEAIEQESSDSVEEMKSSVDDTTVKQSLSGRNFNLKVVSWNVNGIRAALKKNAFDYFRGESCDVLCLQETKCTDKDFPADLKAWDQFPFKYFSASKQPGYAGVAMFSKREPLSVQYGLGIKEHDEEGRIITAFFDDFILVNTYIVNSGRGLVRLKYRMQWDEDLRKYLRNLDSQKPVILCGDLNVAHKEIDLTNPKTNQKTAGFTPEERASFGTLLEVGFEDSFRVLYPDKVDQFTFWSYMREARAKNIGWRLDYFVMSSRLRNALCDNQIRSDVMGSDHCPIALYLAL